MNGRAAQHCTGADGLLAAGPALPGPCGADGRSTPQRWARKTVSDLHVEFLSTKATAVKLRLYYLFHEESAEDARLVRELETSMYALYRDEHHTTRWHRIPPGADVDDEDQRAAAEADIILVMLSPDFLGCDRCFRRSVAAHMERRRGATVVPILLRPVAPVESFPLAGLQILPRNGVPVSRSSSIDEAWQHLTDELKQVIRSHDLSLAPPKAAQSEPDHLVILLYFSLVPPTVLQPFLRIAVDAAVPIFEWDNSGVYRHILGSLFPTVVLLAIGKIDDLLDASQINWRYSKAIRRGLRALWPKFFGPTRTIRASVVASPSGKLDPELYSRTLSLTTFVRGGPKTPLKNQLRLQLLIRDDASQEEFGSSIDSFLDLATCMLSGIDQQLLTSHRDDLGPVGSHVLLAYDPGLARLVVVGPPLRRSSDPDTATRRYAIGLMPHSKIVRLHRVALLACLGDQREPLFSGIDPQFKAGLRTSNIPDDQMLLDLVTMNLVGTLRDGTAPLQRWFANAAGLVRNPADARLFEHAVLQLRTTPIVSRMMDASP